jgi:hypothetical protein
MSAASFTLSWPDINGENARPRPLSALPPLATYARGKLYRDPFANPTRAAGCNRNASVEIIVEART